MAIESLGGKTDQAIKKATGKSWEKWIKILDDAGMQDVPHKQIVQWLWDNGYAGSGGEHLSGWWAQSLVVGYEYHHGRRVKGQTSDAGFEISVQRTVPASPEKVWQFLASDKGLSIWLGGNADQVSLEQGATYELTDGTKGEIRSVSPGKKLRLTYQPLERTAPTTIQIYLKDSQSIEAKTSLLFHHEKLADTKEREAMRSHWQAVLKQIKDALSE